MNIGRGYLFIDMRWCLAKRHISSIKRYNLLNISTQSFPNNITNGDYYIFYLILFQSVFWSCWFFLFEQIGNKQFDLRISNGQTGTKVYYLQ